MNSIKAERNQEIQKIPKKFKRLQDQIIKIFEKKLKEKPIIDQFYRPC